MKKCKNLKNVFGFMLVAALFHACGSPSAEKSSENNTTSEDISATPEGISQLEQEHQLFRAEYATRVNQGLIAEDTMVTSARREAQGQVGEATVTVNYGSPGKRGRVLWNGLVSYDIVWVSGSHWATAVEFSKDVQVAGSRVPAGMYAFFTIPGRETWTLILNKNYDQHLAEDYDQTEDVVRIEVEPQTLEDVMQRLTYVVEESGQAQGEISMMWDQLKISMPFSVI